jgi:NADH:ubiquinone oxidoreductase subunit E
MEVFYLCMGSACYQKGVHEVLPKLQHLIACNNLDIKVELKGAFCLGPCIDGIVMRYKDIMFTNISPDNIEMKFEKEILPKLTNSLEYNGN